MSSKPCCGKFGNVLGKMQHEACASVDTDSVTESIASLLLSLSIGDDVHDGDKHMVVALVFIVVGAVSAAIWISLRLWRRCFPDVVDNASMDVANDPSTMIQFLGGEVDGSERHNILEPKHKIFLSHSGAQKSFVADLHADLVRRDRHAFFDKSRSSLPVGEQFPNLIFNAIEQCAVGVVVLSEEFFTKTKWPMLELVAMMKKSKKPNRRIKIIPVFYKISRDKCRNPSVQNEWMTKYWKKWEQEDKSSRIHVEEWKEALGIFGSTTGLVMKDGMLDGELRGEIVEAVCKIVLPETRWDDSSVQGRTRLYEEFRKKIYGGLKPKDLKGEVRVVGLYGMGGMGKTTACKLLCNALSQDYDDKVCHVEFGNGCELELLKKVLKAFSNLDVEILDDIEDVGVCHGYLKKRIVKERVFLALDNVSDDTKEQAKTFLRRNYGRGSVVVVTTRSVDVLQCVGVEKKNCFAMLELDREEAMAMFLSHCRLKVDKVDEELLEKCMERCYFSKGVSSWNSYGGKHYLPLALKALGIEVGDEIRKHGEARQAELLTRIKNFNMSRQKEHPVFCILRISFDSLLEEDQLLFLHVALFFPRDDYAFVKSTTHAMEWLEMVHGEEANAIESRLECLKRKSLLESFGMLEDDFRMHDLWREFAEAEIKTGKFKDRVYFEDCKRRRGRVDLTRFPEMGVVKLKLGKYPGRVALDLQGLKHLKSLDVYFYSWSVSKVEVKGLGSLENLTFLSLECVLSSECIAELGLLMNLQVVDLSGFRGDKLPDMSKLTSLRFLNLENSYHLRSINLRNLTNLAELHLMYCDGLQSVDISGCTSMTKIDIYMVNSVLQELNVSSCPLLLRVHGLVDRRKLRKLDITGCTLMNDLDGLERLDELEELRASNCKNLGVLPKCRLPKLQVLDIEHCKVPTGFEWAHGLIRRPVRKFEKHCTSRS